MAAGHIRKKHKIVMPKEKRYELLKEVYNILGHKKIYAVLMQLLEQFWWPFLDQDIKWFIQTCHQCQVCQMCYHHILPTVTIPPRYSAKPISTQFTFPTPLNTNTLYKPIACCHHTQNIGSCRRRTEVLSAHLYLRKFSAVGVR
jgi:hypothetical protein